MINTLKILSDKRNTAICKWVYKSDNQTFLIHEKFTEKKSDDVDVSVFGGEMKTRRLFLVEQIVVVLEDGVAEVALQQQVDHAAPPEFARQIQRSLKARIRHRRVWNEGRASGIEGYWGGV